MKYCIYMKLEYDDSDNLRISKKPHAELIESFSKNYKWYHYTGQNKFDTIYEELETGIVFSTEHLHLYEEI